MVAEEKPHLPVTAHSNFGRLHRLPACQSVKLPKRFRRMVQPTVDKACDADLPALGAQT